MLDVTGVQTVLLNRCHNTKPDKISSCKLPSLSKSRVPSEPSVMEEHVTFSLSGSNHLIPRQDLHITLSNSGDTGSVRSHYIRELIE